MYLHLNTSKCFITFGNGFENMPCNFDILKLRLLQPLLSTNSIILVGIFFLLEKSILWYSVSSVQIKLILLETWAHWRRSKMSKLLSIFKTISLGMLSNWRSPDLCVFASLYEEISAPMFWLFWKYYSGKGFFKSQNLQVFE